MRMIRFCLYVMLSSVAVGQASAQKKPNIVYVMADQWRGQATAYNGDPNVRTPNLDELARTSLNFKNAVSVLPVCTPYRAALLTGKYPTTTGMFLNDLYLPAKELTLAEIFKAAGYNTGYIGKWHLDGHGRTAFIPQERRQGFDYWKANECSHNYNKSPYYDNNDTTRHTWPGYDVYAETDDAKKYIADHARDKEPFVLMLAYGAPHFPHNQAPENYKNEYKDKELKLNPNVTADMEDDVRKEAIGYYAHCTAIDSAIGSLRKTIGDLGLDKNTIFVFTADHGEMMGSHGVKPQKKQYFWTESSNIPFLMHYPAHSSTSGSTTQLPISNVDVLPTLLGLCNLKKPAGIEGEDISGFITGSQKIEDRSVLIMNVAPFSDDNNHEFRAVKTSKYTYVKNLQGPWLLFDDTKDSFQMNNLISKPEYKTLAADLDKQLMQKLAVNKDEFKPKEYYIDKFGYKVTKAGFIPYENYETEVQSPDHSK